VDAAASFPLGEGGEEERCALGGLEAWRGADVDAVFGVDLGLQRENVDVFRLYELFLNSRWCKVNEVTKRLLLNAGG
jgi:hypothetical protein